MTADSGTLSTSRSGGGASRARYSGRLRLHFGVQARQQTQIFFPSSSTAIGSPIEPSFARETGQWVAASSGPESPGRWVLRVRNRGRLREQTLQGQASEHAGTKCAVVVVEIASAFQRYALTNQRRLDERDLPLEPSSRIDFHNRFDRPADSGQIHLVLVKRGFDPNRREVGKLEHRLALGEILPRNHVLLDDDPSDRREDRQRTVLRSSREDRIELGLTDTQELELRFGALRPVVPARGSIGGVRIPRRAPDSSTWPRRNASIASVSSGLESSPSVVTGLDGHPREVHLERLDPRHPFEPRRDLSQLPFVVGDRANRFLGSESSEKTRPPRSESRLA